MHAWNVKSDCVLEGSLGLQQAIEQYILDYLLLVYIGDTLVCGSALPIVPCASVCIRYGEGGMHLCFTCVWSTRS